MDILFFLILFWRCSEMKINWTTNNLKVIFLSWQMIGLLFGPIIQSRSVYSYGWGASDTISQRAKPTRKGRRAEVTKGRRSVAEQEEQRVNCRSRTRTLIQSRTLLLPDWRVLPDFTFSITVLKYVKR